MVQLGRRAFLGGTLAAASSTIASTGYARSIAAGDDEDFWTDVALEYDVDDRYTVLNGGGNNPLPRSVISALLRYQELAASQPRPFNYQLIAYRDQHRKRLATLFGCAPDELALTRNTTEGLNIVALGLPLARGDQVILSPYEASYALPRI